MTKELFSLHDSIDDLFNDELFAEFNELPSVFSGSGALQYPQVDISETTKEIRVKANVPGIKPNKIKIEVTPKTLSLSGKHEERCEETGEGFLKKECYFGHFSRSFMLPSLIDPEKVDANIKDGILTIILAKAKTAPSKKTPAKKKVSKKKVSKKKK